MIGTESDPGIMARALNDLFRKIQQGQEHSSYAVKMSYLEVQSPHCLFSAVLIIPFPDLQRDDSRSATTSIRLLGRP